MGMKVLLIDDEGQALEPLRAEIEQGDVEVKWQQVPFEDAEATIDVFMPDLIVLDIFSGSPLPENATGHDRLHEIWDRCFRPVIVYSANPDIVAEARYRQHPFVKLVKKGSDSEVEVAAAIREFTPLIELLRGARGRIEAEFSKALRDVAPLAASSGSDLAHVVERAARRRVAALVDEMGPVGNIIEAWEQYVFPPVSDGIRQGDVLWDEEGADPEHYRIVLTPSCDLVASGGRSPKVGSVLLARCVDMNRALDTLGIGGSKSKKSKSRLRGILNAGFDGHVIVFPPLANHIPPMAADLRLLELIPVGEVRRAFGVVASVDSPFREAIAWAYVRSVGRPGLPERDVDSWIDGVIGIRRNGTKEGG